MLTKKSKYKVKVLSGYRITIPEEIRKRMNIQIGQEVEIEPRGGEIIIRVSNIDPVFSILGIASGAKEKKGDEIFLEELKEKVDRE
ncbi:MAG: AbrB/MazE/SpoVT family DNA-binding domain-containing protein [Candidatus Njordarchaeia archaeon]